MEDFSEYIPENEQGKFALQGLYFNSPSIKAKQLYYYPLWCGEYYVKSPYEIDRKYMDSFIAFWIEEGELSFSFDDRQDFTAKESSLIILDCKERNHYYTKSFCKFMFVHFNGQQIQPLYDYITRDKENRFNILDSEQSTFKQLFKLMKMQTSSTKELDYSELFYRLLIGLVDRMHFGQPDPSTPGRTPEMVTEAIGYLDEHYVDKITIGALCHQLGVSATLLSRNFHIYTNNSIHEYLISVRLLHAKQLLTTQPNLSIAEVADLCGFHDASHLNKSFNQQLGMTPSKFRKMQF